MLRSFVKMLNAGVGPNAVLQHMCTKTNMSVNTLQAFLRYCEENEYNLNQTAAAAMITGFEHHKAQMEESSAFVYRNMERYGVDVEAIRQKASIDGHSFRQ